MSRSDDQISSWHQLASLPFRRTSFDQLLPLCLASAWTLHHYFGLVVTHVFFRRIWPPSGARGMTFEKCDDWAKASTRRMSRARRPVL